MDKAKMELLRKEIEPYLPMLQEARTTIIDQDVSNFPIFVFHQQHVEIGIPLVKRQNVQGNWSVNASTLEEFVARRLIAEENVVKLRERFHETGSAYCLFVLSELGAQFVFLPEE